jgi:hypothetical protein
MKLHWNCSLPSDAKIKAGIFLNLHCSERFCIHFVVAGFAGEHSVRMSVICLTMKLLTECTRIPQVTGQKTISLHVF